MLSHLQREQSLQRTGSQLIALKKEEKAAKRAQMILDRQSGAAQPDGKTETTQIPSQASKESAKDGKEGGKVQHKRSGSNAGDTKKIPLRGAHQAPPVPKLPAAPKLEDKTVDLFRHLYKTRATTIAGVVKEVHPAVLALGQQMSSYVICGSTARLVATLQAFKRVCTAANCCLLLLLQYHYSYTTIGH
jgi:translation initiation factor eIF-2B subunit delta